MHVHAVKHFFFFCLLYRQSAEKTLGRIICRQEMKKGVRIVEKFVMQERRADVPPPQLVAVHIYMWKISAYGILELIVHCLADAHAVAGRRFFGHFHIKHFLIHFL